MHFIFFQILSVQMNFVVFFFQILRTLARKLTINTSEISEYKGISKKK